MRACVRAYSGSSILIHPYTCRYVLYIYVSIFAHCEILEGMHGFTQGWAKDGRHGMYASSISQSVHALATALLFRFSIVVLVVVVVLVRSSLVSLAAVGRLLRTLLTRTAGRQAPGRSDADASLYADDMIYE
eukprot:GHVU01152609.1.p2 GENE.GHVU01152609.1~~GHVU01152609.1.p2  ORF type:complete len:132 (-),score=8.49 GHVU01152609.1:508-903(-)